MTNRPDAPHRIRVSVLQAIACREGADDRESSERAKIERNTEIEVACLELLRRIRDDRSDGIFDTLGWREIAIVESECPDSRRPRDVQMRDEARAPRKIGAET